MTTFLKDGDAIDYTPSVAVTAGDVVVQGTLVGIAKKSIVASVLGALAVVGVFSFDKGTGSAAEALTAGAKVYWDSEAEIVTATAESNTYVGKVVIAAAEAATTVKVRLEQ